MEQGGRGRAIGFVVLLLVALLLLYAGVTGRAADMLAALLTPAYLEED